MLRLIRKHPLLSACAAVAIVSVAVLVHAFATGVASLQLVLPAFGALAVACFVGEVIMNYKVFGGKPNSSVHNPASAPSDLRK